MLTKCFMRMPLLDLSGRDRARCESLKNPAWRVVEFILICVLAVPPVAAEQSPRVESHVVAFGEEGRFGGWPANHGMWSWGDEFLVGFGIGTHKDLGDERHNIDREKPEHHVLARSLDGGATWSMEYPAEKGMLVNPGGMRHGTTDPRHTESEPVPITEPINFSHPDFCMTLRYGKVDGGVSRLYHSYDRGRNWRGPFRVPNLGQPGVMARTDYLVNSAKDCHLMLTVSKADRREGRVVCARTLDGGLTWKRLSFVGPEPSGFSIMPSTVRLTETELLTMTRRREGSGEERHRWIDAWRSYDNGIHWKPLGAVVKDVGAGNPPALTRLRDSRLCLTYGDRKPPYAICAKLSSDQGRTWSPAIVLRTNGGGRDMGYVRTLQRPDGKMVTVYYFTPKESRYRQVVATIWDPKI